MLESIVLVVATSILTSVLTIVLAKIAIDRWGQRIVQQRLEEAGREIERRVRAGALQAADEALPELRKKVQEGFEQGVVALASGSILERSVSGQAKALSSKLDAIFGRKRD